MTYDHRHPALSYSGAKVLLQSPAKYRHMMDTPPETKTDFDLGHAVHSIVLGIGDPIREVPHELWNTKEAKTAVAEVRDAGEIPLKPSQYRAAKAMSESLFKQPRVESLLRSGRAEVPVHWQRDGVSLRAQIDWVNEVRHVLVDVKTSTTADRDGFSRLAYNFGYHIQAAAYLDGAQGPGDPRDWRFVFAVVEKDPPYLSAVYEPDADFIAAGAAKWQQAQELYRECTDTGEWPGYDTDIQSLSLPRWAA